MTRSAGWRGGAGLNWSRRVGSLKSGCAVRKGCDSAGSCSCGGDQRGGRLMATRAEHALRDVMGRRLSHWICASSLALLFTTAGVRSAQASCGDYLLGAHFNGPVGGVPHAGMPQPIPTHEHGCRDGSCRPGLPAPASETSSWELLKHTACGSESVRADVFPQRARAPAEDPTASVAQPTRLFRPPRGA